LIALLALVGFAPLARHSTFARQPGSGWVLVGRYDMDGVRHTLATVWHTRADGTRLLAASLGSLDGRVVDGALLTGRSVTFTLRERVGATSRDLAFTGRWNGHRMAGTLTGPSGTGRLVLRMATTPIVERGLIFAETDASGNPVAAAEVSVVIDSGGALVTGRFANEGGGPCAGFGCSGDVVAFRERTSGRLTVRLRSDDTCPIETEIAVRFDVAPRLYAGTFSATDCTGVRSGTLIAARTAGTNSGHASEMLGALGALADDLEREAPLATPHPTFSPRYLHGSRTLDDLLAGYGDERRLYSDRQASFTAIHSIRTIPDPLALPGFPIRTGVSLAEVREGTPRAGGPRERYVDTERVPAPRRLSVWGEDAGRWVVTGDQFSMDLPFPYVVTDRALEVATPVGTVWVSPGAFGAHNGPHTGHVFGDGKANFIGYLSDGDAEMVDLGNGNGIREPGELWGYYGGLGGERVRNRTPIYVAPAAATLHEVFYRSAPTGVYFDNVPQWAVTLEFANGARLYLDHLGSIAPTLRSRILSELGIDLAAYAGPPGVVVPSGSGFGIGAGEALARPQVMAQPIPGHPGYFAGPGPGYGVPWAQMEFKIFIEFGKDMGDSCVYEQIPRASHEGAQRVMDAQMADPSSIRYRSIQLERWLWAAEGRACMTYSEFPNDFSSLDTGFGGWFEQERPGLSSDEVVAFVRIARDTASYDPLLYDAANIGYLFRRQRAFGVPMDWVMPNGSVVRPFYPAGELLERTDAAFLIKWRDIGYRDASGTPRPVYQWASYVLNADGLKIAFGPFLDVPTAGGPPGVSASTPCNGATVVCFDHVERPGY
jgi:hypothetical protein